MSIEAPPPIDDRNLDKWLMNLWKELIELTGDIIDVTTTVGADTEFSVSHGLSKVPNHVQVLTSESQTVAYIQVRPSGTAWTDTTIFLTCNTATATFKLKVW